MNVIFSILVVLIVIASILLTIAVLLQNGKGDSLASNFVAGNQTFGVRQTANMLEKITWGLVARWTSLTRSRMRPKSSLHSLQLLSCRMHLPRKRLPLLLNSSLKPQGLTDCQ